MSESAPVDAELLETWRSARIWIDLPQRGGIEVTPAKATRPDPFPDEIDAVHLLSAWNPGGVATDLAENQARHRELAGVLDASGIVRWDAAGYSADFSWIERGFALPGVARSVAVRLADDFGQLAIYEWTSESLAIVECRSSTVITSDGWTARAHLAPQPLPD